MFIFLLYYMSLGSIQDAERYALLCGPLRPRRTATRWHARRRPLPPLRLHDASGPFRASAIKHGLVRTLRASAIKRPDRPRPGAACKVRPPGRQKEGRDGFL